MPAPSGGGGVFFRHTRRSSSAKRSSTSPISRIASSFVGASLSNHASSAWSNSASAGGLERTIICSSLPNPAGRQSFYRVDVSFTTKLQGQHILNLVDPTFDRTRCDHVAAL